MCLMSINYRDVVKVKVYGDSQGWVRKMWEQNLERFDAEGTLSFDKNNIMHTEIVLKPNLKKIDKAYRRFRLKIHKAGNEDRGKITYVLEDGREVSPRDVFFSNEVHQIEAYKKKKL